MGRRGKSLLTIKKNTVPQFQAIVAPAVLVKDPPGIVGNLKFSMCSNEFSCLDPHSFTFFRGLQQQFSRYLSEATTCGLAFLTTIGVLHHVGELISVLLGDSTQAIYSNSLLSRFQGCWAASRPQGGYLEVSPRPAPRRPPTNRSSKQPLVK
jgi:hypothetical protein